MKQQWQAYSSKYLQISPREQYLILGTGLVAIIFILYSFVVEPNFIQAQKYKKQTLTLQSSERSLKSSIAEIEAALQGDPNQALEKQIAQYQAKLAKVDQSLLTLTSELINPIQMRRALLELLNIQPGVRLQSFELVGAEQILTATPSSDKATKEQSSTNKKDLAEVDTNAEQQGIELYKHGIKIKLSGGYFQLRDYLSKLEKMSWKFFWQGFDYRVKEYPNSELEIEIYSLSTKKEFIGV